ERNWGYDGVYLYAVQNSYGGPEGLRRLVDACHQKGLVVILDVVYNHLGPEGNYLANFAPYFTEHYRTPWGPALNFDGQYSDEVRRFYFDNALYWITEFHIDALRLDAVHAILDHSPITFLEELAATVHQKADTLHRHVHLFPESADNNGRLVYQPDMGGYGHDAIWNDDFHHSLHVLLTGEDKGYYEDYGRLQHLVKAISEGFVYSGEYSSFHKRRHGSPSLEIPASRFVVCAQNHDQVGNRMMGERLSQLVSYEELKLAAGIVLLSPYIPLLFMGEEYGEINPFYYFVSHSDSHLIEAVRKGRKEEFSTFGWVGEPPDPQDEVTFVASKLNHLLGNQKPHNTLKQFYRELIRLRKDKPSLSTLSKDSLEAIGFDTENILLLRRWTDYDEAAAIFNLGRVEKDTHIALPQGEWRKTLDSADERWNGPGSRTPDAIAEKDTAMLKMQPSSFCLYIRAKEN
ncbi:MAG: malto-oligosyltrehalose trehalohydrolase, partial [Dehalococcoidia bacterium]